MVVGSTAISQVLTMRGKSLGEKKHRANKPNQKKIMKKGQTITVCYKNVWQIKNQIDDKT